MSQTVPSVPSVGGAALVELLRRTFAQSAEIIGRVRPEQYERPTPCPLFDVRTLVGHMLFAAQRVGDAGRRHTLTEDAGPEMTGPADGEWASAFEKVAAQSVDAWSAPGALEGEIVLPFGTFSAPVVAQIYIVEQGTHAWDLAAALGARRLLDAELAEQVLSIAEAVIRPEYRGEEPMPFALESHVEAGASGCDRLAAFMGRRLEWSDNMAASSGDERADLLQTLAKHRQLLRYTVRDLGDDQVRQRTTVSALCLGGILKHVAAVESRWADFIEQGPSAMGTMDEAAARAHAETFVMGDDDTVAGLLEGYRQVAARTDALVASLGSLDASQPLPEAPWFEKGAPWSARRVILHVLAETAQHAGHADIVREALDGAKTMG